MYGSKAEARAFWRAGFRVEWVADMKDQIVVLLLCVDMDGYIVSSVIQAELDGVLHYRLQEHGREEELFLFGFVLQQGG